MAELCKYAVACPVFNNALRRMPHTALRYRERYCRARFFECARFELAETIGADHVPPMLLPNQYAEAADLTLALD
ncbi:MAG: hypothetical protein Kow0067_06250 [Coriobacteriia bacterium]|nr:hypothetical protein [Anaerosomatales bacterium]